MDAATNILDEVPLAALRTRTRTVVSNLMNCCKVLLSPSGYQRDCRGLACLLDIPFPPCICPDPTNSIITTWEKSRNPSISEFISALQQLDRWDVIDDIKEFIDLDVGEFSQNKNQIAEPSCSSTNDSDYHILTLDDVHRIENGLEPQHYDGFLLYADEDASFAKEIVDKLEQDYDLKMCLKDRDLVGGVNIEHVAIRRLINERCSRLVVIVSPALFRSPMNSFFLAYAEALGIKEKRRKIVPCMYKHFEYPDEKCRSQLEFYFILDYTRSSTFGNFWGKLSGAIKDPVLNPRRQIMNARESSITIQEISSEEPKLKPSEWDCPSKASPIQTCQSPIDGAAAIEKATVDVDQPPYSSPLLSGSSKTKKKSTITRLLARLPSPPSQKPEKQKSRWFKKRKTKVIVESQ